MKTLKRFAHWFGEHQKQFAWALVVVCLIGWPLSQFTWASSEPPTTLGLSWLAMLFVAYDILRGEQRDR